MTDSSTAHHITPDITGAASARLEKFSATVASTTWYDITVNGKNGTANNASLYSDFMFNGINNTVATAIEAPLLPATNTWTLQIWTNRLGSGTLASTKDGNNGWALRDSPADANLEYSSFPYNGIHIAAPATTGWFHLALTWTPGAPPAIKSYVDGVLYSTMSGPPAVGDYNPLGQPLVIGSGTAGFYTGNIDTVRVYSRALSPDEILRDYHAGKPAHP